MNKKFIIRKNEEIANIVKAAKRKSNNVFNIYYIESMNGYSRYCVSVSKKIGNAVVRNKYKRIVKDILTKKSNNNSYNYVIIIKKAILNLKYLEIEEELCKLLEEIK